MRWSGSDGPGVWSCVVVVMLICELTLNLQSCCNVIWDRGVLPLNFKKYLLDIWYRELKKMQNRNRTAIKNQANVMLGW
jgi:hypothetical protein